VADYFLLSDYEELKYTDTIRVYVLGMKLPAVLDTYSGFYVLAEDLSGN